MHFSETDLPGVWLVQSDVFADERGAFEPAWTLQDFAANGLDTAIAQVGLAHSLWRGTLRGLHYQASPLQQAKTIRVMHGAIFDVAVDLRPDSPTFRQWIGCELSDGNHRALYIPKGVAHGYQTLTDDAVVMYSVSAPYAPDCERGVRWNDPAFSIAWPIETPAAIHPRDASYPDFV